MINVLILENNIPELQLLDTLLTKYNPQWKLLKASTYKEALIYIENNPIQLFLLSMELSKENFCENGIELAKILKTNSRYQHTPIIFITEAPERIYKTLNENYCYYYLLKPYNQEKFYSILDAIMTSPLIEKHPLLIKDPAGVYIQLNQKDILYITIEQKQLFIHTFETTFHATGITMNEISKKLYSTFVRCHKKYIINLNEIESYDRSNCLIHIKNTDIPVGRCYKKTFEQTFMKSFL